MHKKVVTKILQRLPTFFQPKLVEVATSGDLPLKLPRPFETAPGRSMALHGLNSLEPEVIQLMRSLIGECRTFFDIGANIGLITGVAKCFNQKLRIWSFEPERHACELLREMIKVNQWSEVWAENIALGTQDREAVLFVPEGETEASTNPSFRKNTRQQLCRERRLDSFCAEAGISSVDLLKIDTESTEPDVLAGGVELIGDCKPDIICEVLHGRTERRLQEFLSPFGYKFFHLTGPGPVRTTDITGDPSHQHLNYFFTVRDRP